MLDLSRLLRPRSIAVIGGGAWAPAVIEQCQKMGFDGPVWPVHPTRADLGGLPCYRTVDELPAAPDAVFVGVNRHASIETLAALSARGAGGAICFASGFAEAADDAAAGAELQDRLVAAAGDMPVIGPNCYGVINYLDGALLWPDQHGGRRVERGVAIVGQSSNVLINLTMQRRGVPLAYVMAAGNQAQIGLAEMAMAVMEDPRVTAVGLHIEGIGDVRAFEAMAARARALGKPVVALKVGRTEAAQAAALSHTASLAGGTAAGQAFLARCGVPVLPTLASFLEALKLLHVHGALPGRDLCSMSCSGGEASLMADAAEGRGIRFRPLTENERQKVAATLSELVTVVNPLDFHTFIWGDVQRMTGTFAAMMGCGFDLSMLICDFPRTDRCDDAAWACSIDGFEAAVARTGARAAMVASLPENLPEERAERLMNAGIAPMMGFEETLDAAAAAAEIGAAWAAKTPAPVLPGAAGDGVVLDESAAKAMLAAHGVAVPEGRRAATACAAGEAAAALGGKLVLKGLGLAHKTEAGAVALGLTGAEEVRTRAEAMAGADGYLVERMVDEPVAELIVGVVTDPVCGLTLTIGAGGVLTELLKDRATLCLPASEPEIAAALDGLRVSRLLGGWRGKPAADRGAVIAAIMGIQTLAIAEAGSLIEMDINPLMATAHGAVAVDALIVRKG